MRRLVVGMAGHVDHGKTALVRALTGVEGDRLPEEKARGITMELGFARWRLADDVEAAIVDVPGHERLVRTMAAGAQAVDVLLLVVAADDGVMPQTREHLAIARLLGVRAGFIALTKVDRVDEETRALAMAEVEEVVHGTFLEGAPLVPCSLRTGEGLAEVAAVTLRISRTVSARPPSPSPYLPVDRVFVKRGSGVVVTGTLARGVIRVGDELDAFLPAVAEPRRVRVHQLRIHDDTVREAGAGTRLALALRGIEPEAIARGASLHEAGLRKTSIRADALVELLPGERALSALTEYQLHVGTDVRRVRLVPFVARAHPSSSLPEGATRIRSDAPVVLFAGQRFLLRTGGAQAPRTIGGGVIVDPQAPVSRGALRRESDAGYPRFAEDVARRLAGFLLHAGARGLSLAEVRERAPPHIDAAALVEDAVSSGQACPRLTGDAGIVDKRYVLEAEADVRARLSTFHRRHPYLVGMALAELRTQVPPARVHVVENALASLRAGGAVVTDADTVRLSDHVPATLVEGPLAMVSEVYEAASLRPPTEEEALRLVDLDRETFRDAVASLKRQGQLRAVGPFAFADSALDRLAHDVRAHFSSAKVLSTADFKALSGGLSRKYAIPLLEWLDGRGLTRRHGDVRLRGAG